MTLRERLTAKCRRAKGGCLEFNGARDMFGYGRLRVGGKQVGAHRVAYELEHGPIPHGVFILHHCDNPACVEPMHLYAGSKRDNASDRERRGRGKHAKGADHYQIRNRGVRGRGKFIRVRSALLPDELWDALTAYALELTAKERKQVSTSEAMRRILERALKRREKKP